MSEIKVLHVHTLPVVSGSGIYTLLAMKGLDKSRYRCELATAPDGPLIDEAVKQGIQCRPVKHLVRRLNLYHDLIALWELFALIKRQKYDIVHTHNAKAGFTGRLAAKLAGVPIIIYTIHGFSFHQYEKFPRKTLFIWLERFAACFSDKLLTVSRPLKEVALQLGIGKPDQYITIYDGIEIDRFSIDFDIQKKRKEFDIKPSDFVVGVVSKLWKGKGHREILEAAKEVITKAPNVKFMFVGEGYLRQDLKALTQRLGLSSHVIFTGFRTDIPEITAIFDIAILASFFEGLGRVLLEAMVLNKPVIATNVGGIVDVVDDGKTGILVPPANSAALAKALLRLLSDSELRVKMGRAGREKIDAKFSAKTMVNRIERVYNELIVRKVLKKR
ncbi:MAG: glycosyltransferase family 4 protein [Candidatus Omnitrophota bacterium]|nr:MAG: glycosyltransferase family 4 protein [Candidatus Omnitrophota bacterium]